MVIWNGGSGELCSPCASSLRVCYSLAPSDNNPHESRSTSVIWPRGYKTFFVLNSVEHEILNAHKYKNIKKFGIFKAQLSLECYFSRSYMLKCQQLLAF